MKKYRRQTKLAEIGAAGQEKLAAAEVAVASGFAGWIEARYLAAAGVGRTREGGDARDARFDDLDPAAREVALGAHAAARAILEIVSR